MKIIALSVDKHMFFWYNLDGGNMAITKTNFVNYSRCKRFVALDEVKKERLNSYISYEKNF